MRNSIIRSTILAIVLLANLQACTTTEAQNNNVDKLAPEVIYHVFQRSFYDSNGDANGDLNGLRDKLDYLQDLGITSILMVPLYESVYYHNYFSSDFEKIDPTYGNKEDYLALVHDIHERGMKIYMDMETQYVTQEHLWYKDSYKNPKSIYSDYILYEDSLNEKPSTIVADLTELVGYNGVTHKITTVNLLSKGVLEYNKNLFKHWVDPNNDGDFSDGVDGFRLDHMMDHLDNKPQLQNLFAEFWKPLISSLKELNPNIKIIAEQADWSSYGIDYLTNANVDDVFAFRLMGAIRNMNKKEIASMADTIFSITPKDKGQIVFIENHDIPRFATVVKKDLAKIKVGAALNLLIGGIPSIYYGQEIGMAGGGSLGLFGGITDANEIPEREAFEWYKSDTGKGMALWYKDSGPWWDQRNNQPNDGISLEEQKDDPSSIWNYYKTLIQLRKSSKALGFGDYISLNNPNDQLYSFMRYIDDQATIVIVNLSSESQSAAIELQNSPIPLKGKSSKVIFGDSEGRINGQTLQSNLAGYGVQVFELIK